MKQYRLQKRDHLGVVPRAFAGRVISWGRWQTITASGDLEDVFLQCCLFGEIVYG